MAMVKIRVRQYINGRLSRGSADAAPYAAIVGRLGHSFVRMDLTARQLETLAATGVFEIVDDDGSKVTPKRLVTLEVRRPVGRVIKLRGGSSSGGEAA